MKLKNYLRIGFIIPLLLMNVSAPNGIVKISDQTLFQAKKIDFYNRVYNELFNTELLKECLYYEKIQHPEIVLIQSEIETGHYTSDIFLMANNLFGMRFARVRETTAIGEYSYHAKYSHWTESVKDYKLWQDYYESRGYRINDEYLAFLQYIRYATDRRYIAKIIQGMDSEAS
jgi:hypothetical protein